MSSLEGDVADKEFVAWRLVVQEGREERDNASVGVGGVGELGLASVRPIEEFAAKPFCSAESEVVGSPSIGAGAHPATL